MSHRVEGVDALRGLAATGVVFVHAAYILPLQVSPGALRPFSFGYFVMGVPLFFVISAFSMRVAYPDGVLGRGTWQYVTRRFFRIAPLFYVILGLWMLLYLKPDTASLVRNLTFTFGLFPEKQTSLVPAGWSIGVEAIFYALFPLLVLVRGPVPALLICVASLLVSHVFNGLAHPDRPDYFYWTNFLTNAPYFAFGFLAYEAFRIIPPDRKKIVGRVLLVLGVALIAALITWGPIVDGQLTSKLPLPPFFVLFWGSAFGLIVLSQALLPNPVLVNRGTLFLGTISYSLYLLHPLLIYASGITTWVSGLSANAPLALFLVMTITLACLIPLSYLLYFCVERPFVRLGRYVARRPGSSSGQARDLEVNLTTSIEGLQVESVRARLP